MAKSKTNAKETMGMLYLQHICAAGVGKFMSDYYFLLFFLSQSRRRTVGKIKALVNQLCNLVTVNLSPEQMHTNIYLRVYFISIFINTALQNTVKFTIDT